MATTLHRPVCDLLGCAYPIVLAGMGGVARSELVAALTEGDGFRFVGMVREPVDLIVSEVSALRTGHRAPRGGTAGPGPDWSAVVSEDARSAAARRAVITAQIQTETAIDEAMIDRLIRGFYARVRDDDVLGPIFAKKIEDWEPHLQKMCAFWSSVALMSGRYHGQPMAKHLPLPIDARHFDRWLALFETTARDLCPPKAAEHFAMLAGRIAESLELGVARARGLLLRKGERLKSD